MSAKILLLLGLLLASCGPQTDGSVSAVLKEGGPPVRWKLGNRILVEGKIRRTSAGYFLIENRMGAGERANDNCGIIRGAQGLWSPLRWTKVMLADTGWTVAVIGRSTELLPYYPTPDDVQHRQQSCLFAIEVERIELR